MDPKKKADPHDPNVARPTRSAHGEPIGTSREEEGLEEDGALPEDVRRDARERTK